MTHAQFRTGAVITALLFFGLGMVVRAETMVHGISIPTVDETSTADLRVCTTTSQPVYPTPGTSFTRVMVCRPNTDDGPRVVKVPNTREVKEVARDLETLEALVTFDHDSFKIQRGAGPVIARITEWFARYPDAHLRIAGHTDATGTSEYNMELSRHRAQRVANFLEFAGLPATRIIVEWHGETQLLVDTDKPEVANRRVTLQLILPADPIAK